MIKYSSITENRLVFPAYLLPVQVTCAGWKKIINYLTFRPSVLQTAYVPLSLPLQFTLSSELYWLILYVDRPSHLWFDLVL